MFLEILLQQTVEHCLRQSILGTPNLEISVRSLWTVESALAVFMGMTSNHFELVSTTMRNILPSSGPAKSTWS